MSVIEELQARIRYLYDLLASTTDSYERMVIKDEIKDIRVVIEATRKQNDRQD